MKLSVIIPNRNDTVMLGITIRVALEALKALDSDYEIIVVDNSDEDLWRLLNKPDIGPLCLGYQKESKLKLLRQEFPSMYSARSTGIREAQGEYVFNMDSHVLTGYHTIKDLIEFMDTDIEEKIGFVYAPIGWMNRHERLSKHYIDVSEKIFGPWGKHVDESTKICWNFGSCICRRKWFLETLGGYGFFDRERISWGGGEFYIALKSWLLGFENWAIPTNPQYHIGPFSKELEKLTSYRYRLYGTSGNGKQGLGILSAFYALGGNEAKGEARKSEGLKTQYGLDVDKDWVVARKKVGKDRQWILEHQAISFQQLLKERPWETT